MTTILPSARSPFDVIMQQVGSGLSETLPGAVKEYGQRQRGMDALETAKKEIAEAKGDPMKIAMAMSRVAIASPEASKALGSIAQTAMNLSAGQGTANALAGGISPGGENISRGYQNQPDQNISPLQGEANPFISAETQQPQPASVTLPEGKKTAKDVDTIANQYIGEVRPDLVNPETQYGNIATFDSEIKQDLTPEEEGRLRQQLFDKYKNPAIVNPVIDRIREGIKNRYNEALSKYGFDKEKRQQIQKKWDDFSQGTPQRLAPHLQKYGNEFPQTKEILQNKYNQYAGALPVNMTPEQMHTNAMELLQNDINKLDALKALPSMPPVRNAEDVKDYIETHKKAYKDLADMGFIGALKEDAILNKDMGNEEFHLIIWGDQTSKQLLNQLHSYEAPQEYHQINKAMPGVKRYNEEYPKQKEKYINNISNTLKKLKPQDDLILARSMVLDNKGDIKDFVTALDKAQNEGLKLSEFQRSQLQEINIPRHPPLWELFQPEGLLISPFINYIRGKR